jgi:hypothetical protein
MTRWRWSPDGLRWLMLKRAPPGGTASNNQRVLAVSGDLAAFTL